VKYWTYFWHVLKHKWLMFGECRTLGVPWWIAFIHDLDKFFPDEFIGHATAFMGHNAYTDTAEFLFAANLHTKRNPHHWQFWVLPRNDGRVLALPIPDAARREMLADWRASAKARGACLGEWYTKNKDGIQLHPQTRSWIESQL
jgi:hypothetical protein